jgi:hypothetical protein
MAPMAMRSGVRKFILTTHVTSSVGWFGAVAAFLALSVAGLTNPNPQIVRGAYLSMELTTWFVIVPLSVAALLTGLVESLGTTWGLFRHYWVIAKLGLTVLATIILLVHTQPIGAVAAVAAKRMLSSTDLRQLRIQLIADAGAALLALLVATTLSVYKPWGMTSYGRRVVGVEIDLDRQAAESTLWTRLWVVGIIVVLALFITVHIISGGLHQH